MYATTKTIIHGTEFNVSSRYRIIKPVGSGAYGVVVAAEDVSTGKRVAIKKIGRTFQDLVSAKRILREIKIMRFFGDHENLVTLYDMELPDDPKRFEDVYIITELMETDLHKIIYSKQRLTEDHMAYFMYQLLRGIKYTQSSNIVHRDLKPSNILLNSNCDLRVCDFGLARGLEDLIGGSLTEYVVTRWYRAPEIMLGCRDYTKAVDMWSIGCIFAELMRRKPLFAGSDYMDQLKLITGVLGSPSTEDLSFVKSERALAFMARQGVKPKQEWSKLIKRANPMALDLLDKLLAFNPAKRVTVEQALAHPYFSNLQCPSDEPSHPSTFDCVFEAGAKMDKATLQKLMYEEILALKQAKACAAALAATRSSMSCPLPPVSPTTSAGSDTMSGCGTSESDDSEMDLHNEMAPAEHEGMGVPIGCAQNVYTRCSTPLPEDVRFASVLMPSMEMAVRDPVWSHIPRHPVYVVAAAPAELH